ncbi:hypothetical protein SAMN05661010_02615 [Modicisalibacter muralis]|uniref:Membrane-associated protein n=1 Tax=Modicisalibacter muralis TaxID=119000 RepID=A0A1G9N264_9GAMM|nr:hypothetical protein [Halomonas muralis]SDL80612.1 hypothetical protein SAMN05661010_02615 [Halomonas muralis]
MPSHYLPLWLKLAFTLWVLVWAPAYAWKLGWQNFLWLCDLASFLILIALWTENRLLISAQLLAVFVVGVFWAVDVGSALITGIHPIGGTEYMFDAAMPLGFRLLSLFHLVLPLVAVYAVFKLGYDRRGLWLQIALTWLVLPLSLALTDPERNINWVQGPFGQSQTPLDPIVYLLGLMIGWPLALYLPTHLLVIGLQRLRAAKR